jgi:hypothetical protein
MSCTIEASANRKYIVQTITGEITRELAIKYNEDAHAMGKLLGIKKYLVDLRKARNVDTVSNNYNFAYKDMQEDSLIDVSARVVVVVSPDDHSHDFIETVAKNSGLDVTLFADLEKAVEYLTR